MAELVAGYMGTENGKYKVNVRDLSAPSDKLGAAGLVKSFDNPEDAQAFIEAVNNKPLEQPGQDGFQRSTPVAWFFK